MSSMMPIANDALEDRVDPAAIRAKLAGQRGPRFWRSLEELADSEGFRAWLRSEHPQLAEAASLDRRDFLKLLGASLALAGLAGCSHPPRSQIVPYVHKPVGQVDGLPRYFATTLTRQGYAHGVLVRDDMGRPTKVEGNPQHPASLGSTGIFAQAAILQLWDPDRSQSVMHGNSVATWDDFAAALTERVARFHANGGEGLRLLIAPTTSPTLTAQLAAFEKRFPNARWHVDDPAGIAGRSEVARCHFDRAKVIVSLDADFLSDPAAGVRRSRDFIAARDPEAGAMSRLYVIEPTPSVTGGMADHRLPIASRDIEAFAAQLAARIGAGGAAGSNSAHARWIDATAKDLAVNRGASIVVAGNTQPESVHALARAMNASLGNVGRTIEYTPSPVAMPTNGDGSLATLVDDMHAGKVDTLLMLGVNPVYDAPADVDFIAAMRKVPHTLHLGLYDDETGQLAAWHAPQAHELEAWGDALAFDGTISLAQPLIAPLYDGHSAIETMALLLGDPVDGHTLIRRQWQSQLADDKAWNEALQVGVVNIPARPRRDSIPPPLRGDPLPAEGGGAFFPLPKEGRSASERARSATRGMASAANRDIPPRLRAERGEKLELLFRPDPTIGYGEWSNNGWLQELPKPLTQLTWDNVVLVSPALAKQKGLDNFDGVELRSGGRSVRGAVWIMPGQAERSVTIHFGYGRRHAGRVADGQGFDAYALRTKHSPWSAANLEIIPTGERYEIAQTQHHFAMEGRDPLRVGTLDEFKSNPKFATAHDRYGSKPPSLYPDEPPADYAWGMSIDLNACIGCKACTIACQAENNIPIVGKVQVRRGREMHWIRVDRYYDGEAANPKSYSQPVPCMMCEHAPCEVVCPVDATVHNAEGLNVQVYNRCVGTRFCSNNCPYKVRRFNFMQYADKTTPQYMAMRNPEVTVRRRGVMEKCTYCIQRIETAHIEADKANRRIADGEIVTACQAACPTQAIRFGDIADKESGVSKAKASPRNYAMLNELGTRPRTTYLARIRNPNPALEEGEP
ncbi:MAG: Molybdopterin oxidoreductase, iron-sulfur binding subunit [Rhodanobacteraceae bacterium]|jgi:molybdopterin-containing oxidoreductase family iron-sulfur binding subunit|nr:MAG: Molybdopterin oxidoreductase, iron-sulfur binding subunit [Rhodanobacteraceae bacterium]